MAHENIDNYLESELVSFEHIKHSPTYTAQETAASAHIPGQGFAKTVIVRVDGKLAMVVLPAFERISFARLKEATGATSVELASEQEIDALFPEYERGAMPPFGNLYGIPVYVSKTLSADEKIAFNAGSHTDLIKLKYKDFERLVHPEVAILSL